MATKYAISTEFSIVDRATAQLNKMTAAGKGFGGVWQRGIADAQARMDAFGKSAAKSMKWVIGGATGALGIGIKNAIAQYADFDKAILAAGAAYGPAFSQAENFKDKISDIGKAVRSVAASTEFNATESANAFKALALAGVSSDAAIKLLPGVADLATAAMVDMETAAGIATDTLNKMGLASTNPEKYAKNLTLVSDIMTHTANSAKMSLQDAAAAIKVSGSNFLSVNNDLNVLSGGLTALAKSGLAGAEAGTAMRNIMQSLISPKTQKAMKSFGIQTADATGNLLPLPQIIGQINKATAGMGDIAKGNVLNSMFNKYDIAAVTSLLNTGQSALEEFTQAAANSAGTVTANAEAIRQSFDNKLKLLQSAIAELQLAFTDALKEKAVSALDAITKAISEFNPKPLVDALVFVGNVIMNVANFAWHLRYVIGIVAGAFLAWRAGTTAAAIVLGVKNTVIAISTGLQIAYGMVMKQSAAATSAFAFATGKAKVAAILFSGALKVVTAAQTSLNAAFVASPIGWIVLGIGLLIGLAVALANKWRGISTAVDGFFERMRNMSGIGGMIVRSLVAPFEMVWNIVRNVFDIVAAFKIGGFIAGIKMIGVAILQCICAPVEALLSMLSNIPVIGDMFAGWNERMHNWIDGMRADILAVKETEKDEAEAVTTPPPTATDAQASSYSFQESTTTNRLEVAMAAGLEGRMVGKPAPVFSIYAGR
ncbi:MAG: phage tail tape measure protein [Treponema sp.]|nr:phage tail tape measure protein [Treponema sp.]